MTLSNFAEEYRLKTAFECDSTGEHIQENPRIIPGRKGHIFEHDDIKLGVLFMPDARNQRPNVSSARAWNIRKEQLLAVGCTILQDCDGEGSALFDPADPKQARVAMAAAGIRPKRVLSPERLAVLQEWGKQQRIIVR